MRAAFFMKTGKCQWHGANPACDRLFAIFFAKITKNRSLSDRRVESIYLQWVWERVWCQELPGTARFLVWRGHLMTESSDRSLLDLIRRHGPADRGRDGGAAGRDAHGGPQPPDAAGRLGDGRASDRARRPRPPEAHLPGERRGAQAARARTTPTWPWCSGTR